MTKAEHELDLAYAQLTGFFHCEQGHSLESLIDSMALKPNEWKELRKKMHIISEADKQLIDLLVK